MDFTFNEEQLAVQEAAAGLFAGLVTPDRVQEVEATDDRFDRPLWAELAQADLLGLPVPEAYGGGGFGMVELWLCSRPRAARWPWCRCGPPWPSGSCPSPSSDRSTADAVLPGVVSGRTVLTAALVDVASDIALGGTGRPKVRRHRHHRGLTLSGTAFAVPYAHVADRILVPAPSMAAWSSRSWSRGRRPERGAGGHHQPRDPSPSPPRRGRGGHRVPAGRGRPGPGGRGHQLHAGPGPDRSVRPPGRGDRGRGGPDRRVPQHPGAVRPAPVDLSGDHAAGRRRRHRHRVDPGHHVAGRLAAGPRAGRRTGGECGLLVRGRGRTAGRLRHPAPPRGHGRGHLVPHPPVLPVGQADRAAAGITQRPAGPAGQPAGGGLQAGRPVAV